MSSCTVTWNSLSTTSGYFTVSDINYSLRQNRIFFFHPGTSSWVDYTDGGSSAYQFSITNAPFFMLAFGNSNTRVDNFGQSVILYKNNIGTITYSSSLGTNVITKLPTSTTNYSINTTTIGLSIHNDSSSATPISFNINSDARILPAGESDVWGLTVSSNTISQFVIAQPLTYNITAQNTQNMKQIQVGSTVYNTFPASIPITGNTTLQCSGEDDKTITVNYTNTSVPVISDT